jgi:hypothetical protein
VARTKEEPDSIVTMADRGQIKVEQVRIKDPVVRIRERIRVIQSLAITFEDSIVKSFKRGPYMGELLP